MKGTGGRTSLTSFQEGRGGSITGGWKKYAYPFLFLNTLAASSFSSSSYYFALAVLILLCTTQVCLSGASSTVLKTSPKSIKYLPRKFRPFLPSSSFFLIEYRSPHLALKVTAVAFITNSKDMKLLICFRVSAFRRSPTQRFSPYLLKPRFI